MWESKSLYMIGHHIHMVFMLMILVGILLFLRWAWMQKAEVLMSWSKKLLVIGVIGAILTGCFGGGMMRYKHKGMWDKDMMTKKMMMDKGGMMDKGDMMMDMDEMPKN